MPFLHCLMAQANADDFRTTRPLFLFQDEQDFPQKPPRLLPHLHQSALTPHGLVHVVVLSPSILEQEERREPEISASEPENEHQRQPGTCNLCVSWLGPAPPSHVAVHHVVAAGGLLLRFGSETR